MNNFIAKPTNQQMKGDSLMKKIVLSSVFLSLIVSPQAWAIDQGALEAEARSALLAAQSSIRIMPDTPAPGSATINTDITDKSTASPSAIVAGANVLNKENIGCYARRDSAGNAYVQPLVGADKGQWVPTGNYALHTSVSGIDVYALCLVTDLGLDVVITGTGYTPRTYSATWTEGKPTRIASSR